MSQRLLTLLSSAALVLLAGAASGAPAAPSPGAKAAKVVVPSQLQGRLSRSVTKNGVTKSAQELLDTEFDGTEALTLPSGAKIGIQELLDRMGQAEAKAQAAGGSMTALAKRSAYKTSTAGKLASQKSAFASENTAPASTERPPSVGAGCTAATCVPTSPDRDATWSAQKGDEDVVAAYTSFSVKSSIPGAYDAACGATWDNGVYLLGAKHSVLKFTASVAAKKKPAAAWSGSAALYILGQSSPVWHKDGTVDLESLDRSFKTPEARLSYTLVPGIITASGTVQANATLSFRPVVKGSASASAVACSLGIEPRLVASVTGGIQLTVGIDKVAELATGGLKGEVKAADVRLPTKLTISVTESPLTASLDFQSDLATTLASGHIWVWYKIADVCNKKGTLCLVEDVLGISTTGDMDVFDWDGVSYTKNLVAYHGSLGWKH